MNPAKQVFVALGGLLVLGHCVASAETLACAEDVNKLELGTHDLAEMKTLKGVTVIFDPTKIIMVFTLPRSSGGGTTNVIGLAGGPLEIDEPARNFVQRLNLFPYFIYLTLPDGVPVWVKAAAVSMMRAVESWDNTRSEAKSALIVGGRAIFVKENVAAIKDAINALRNQNRSR